MRRATSFGRGHVAAPRSGVSGHLPYPESKGTWRRRYVYEDGLAVECWCRATVVSVPRDEVMKCLTRSCGETWCKAPTRPG